jgi:hypothetical protein
VRGKNPQNYENGNEDSSERERTATILMTTEQEAKKRIKRTVTVIKSQRSNAIIVSEI